MVRYADDIVVVTKSKRAAEHMLESCRKFLEGKLKLTMNLQKSKVVSLFSIRNFKFLGCCLGKNGRGIYIRVHRNSLQKAKQKLRELTNREPRQKCAHGNGEGEGVHPRMDWVLLHR